MHLKIKLSARALALLLILTMLCPLLSITTGAENEESSEAVNNNKNQIVSPGGTIEAEDGKIQVSKTIEETGIENVFDITLTVKTEEKIYEIIKDPDLAVVIVMDISNTMLEKFGSTTRYSAAMESAEKFIDKFAAETYKEGRSRLGFVAFNTDAHQIFELQACTDENMATDLKNKMRNETGKIINANDYGSSHSRFTNIEAGLKMAKDMLDGASNQNKFIIFLSDGFPTTYVSSGYNGYDPYCTSGNPGTAGVFYDSVRKKYCDYGTSYSDRAAIKAREMATAIKNSSTKIFSIGIDVGGQTIKEYVDSFYKDDGTPKAFSVVDRTGETYEIGDASSSTSYKNWLKTSIGSEYYYDSTDDDELKAAFDDIFAEIKETIQSSEATKAQWVTADPMNPLNTPTSEYIEFIYFYAKDGKTPVYEKDPDSGKMVPSKKIEADIDEEGIPTENTVSFNTVDKEITWDLKKSTYTPDIDKETQNGAGTTYYYYKLKYRIRLENEQSSFVGSGDKEINAYPTNGTTTLQYQVIIEDTNGNKTYQTKSIEYEVPTVKGYLAELKFKKVDDNFNPVPGAVFTLTHIKDSCKICGNDNSYFPEREIIQEYEATSDEDGIVCFEHIPSGHEYSLAETKAPPGYIRSTEPHTIKIAYGAMNYLDDWDGKTFVNNISPELPATGGSGTLPFFIIGSMLITLSLCGMAILRKRPQ